MHSSILIYFKTVSLFGATTVLQAPDNCGTYRNQTGQSFNFMLTGSVVNYLYTTYGTNIYTDNSPLSQAAVHAGVLANGETKTVTVTILAGQPTYLGTTSNGVTSSSSGNYAGSYFFGTLTSPTNLINYRNKVGLMFPFILTGINKSAAVYGTDIYSDNSNLAAAAVHAGVLLVGQTKIVIVTILGGQSSYLASTRNSITSSSLDAGAGSYSFTALTSPSNLVDYRNNVGQVLPFLVTGSVVNYLYTTYGTNIYTDNSPLSQAAVHAGVLANGETKIITVTILAGQPTYLGTSSNGVTSSSSGNYAGSYFFGTLTSPTNLINYRNKVGLMFPFILTGIKANAAVYGTDIYSDNSNLAAAAVHAGVLLVGQTKIVIVTILGGQSSYLASTRNSITSSSLNAWAGSYSFNALTSPSNLVDYRNNVGQVLPFLVTGSVVNYLYTTYGTNIYTDNSPLSQAAVHAGVLVNGETNILLINILQGFVSYNGTTRNGITSYSYGVYAGSYSFAPRQALSLCGTQ